MTDGVKLSSVHGIGIDGIEIERVRRAVLKHGDIFLNRVYTAEEICYCLEKKNPYPSLAVRFAAKEAIAKAFGVGIGAFLGWKSIRIFTNDRGAPNVELDNKAQDLLSKFKAQKILVSLSHTNSFAQAVAILT